MENNPNIYEDALRYVYLTQEQYDSLHKPEEKDKLENKNKEEDSKK